MASHKQTSTDTSKTLPAKAFSIGAARGTTDSVMQSVSVSNDKPFMLIAGPCVMESPALADEVAACLHDVTTRLGIGWVFKTSFDKANRTSVASERGPGLEKGLQVLADIKARYGCPVLTDVHLPEQCEPLSHVVDVLQIPAFLCRQTDLVVAAAQTKLALNIKKGQFLAPWDMDHVAQKAISVGAEKIMLCERGASFGYNTLVVDFRSLPRMARTGWPVIMDATHAVQQPGGQGASSGGQRTFVEPLARAAVAIGVAGLYIETHPDPCNALSDGPNMVPLKHMEGLLRTLQNLDKVAKATSYQPIL